MSLLIRQLRRLIIAVVGVTVLLIGVAMIVLPGPAFLVIPFGLSILALEFAWAKRLLDRVKQAAGRKIGSAKSPDESGSGDPPGDDRRRAS